MFVLLNCQGVHRPDNIFRVLDNIFVGWRIIPADLLAWLALRAQTAFLTRCTAIPWPGQHFWCPGQQFCGPEQPAWCPGQQFCGPVEPGQQPDSCPGQQPYGPDSMCGALDNRFPGRTAFHLAWLLGLAGLACSWAGLAGQLG